MPSVNAIPVASAFAVQGRVVVALILREVHTLYGNTRLGYLWAVIQTAFGIGVFWGIRAFMGFYAPHGMGIVMFLLCGFIPWQMFCDIVYRCMAAVRANQALLTFPQVGELDLMLARTVVVWGTQLVSATVIVSVAVLLGQPITLREPASLAAVLFAAPCLGLGVGLVCASLARFWPTLEKLVPMAIRILFFTSGVFFTVSRFPSRFADVLLLNPMMHIIEWQRRGFSATAESPAYSVEYIAVWCAGALCLGLLLERCARGREIA